jgi:HEAT repeat protein
MCRRRFSLLFVSAYLLIVPVRLLAAGGTQKTELQRIELSQQVTRLVEADDADALRALGPAAIPAMAWLYGMSDEPQRVRIANLFYQIGIKSDEAERALMRDVHTDNPGLRLAVQYALGRVSDDPEVIATLLDTLQNDHNPLFRDKAACALAYDQIHLTEEQKVRVYEGLIQALSNPEPQVRAISIQALSILTGQTKGYHHLYPEERRERSIALWQKWLEDYRASL